MKPSPHVASRSEKRGSQHVRLRDKTPSAPQVPETADPVIEALEAAHAAAVAAKEWARARVLASELDARQEALNAGNVVPLPSPARKKS